MHIKVTKHFLVIESAVSCAYLSVKTVLSTPTFQSKLYTQCRQLPPFNINCILLKLTVHFVSIDSAVNSSYLSIGTGYTLNRFRRCVKVEEAVLGPPSLISLMFLWP